MPKISNLFPWKRRSMEQDLDRELRHHIDTRVEHLRSRGVGEADARRQAALEFGGVSQIKEETRETWIWRWLDNLARDLRYAARTLRRTPGFTATAMLSLALGIGANTAIFSLFDQLLLRPLSVKEPERLVLVDWLGGKMGTNWGSGNLMSYPFCRDLQAQDRFFDGVVCRHPTTSFVSTGGRPETLLIEIVSGSYFDVLGVRPGMGRFFDQSADQTPDASPFVVISHSYWVNKLGGAPDVIGRRLLINANPMTVIGVAPADFRGVDPAQIPALWVPVSMHRQANRETIPIMSRRSLWLHIFGRLKPGISAQQAKTGLQPWFRSLLDADMSAPDFPRVTAEQRSRFLASTIDVTPAPGGRSDLRNRMEEPLWVLMAGTLLLLLLACVNAANLFLARGAARVGEVTTRLALGASRGRISGQLLSESLLIAIGGGLLGLFLAPYISEALLSFVSNDLSPRLSYRVFLFGFAICVVTGGLCGLIPALRAARVPLVSSMKERSRTATGGGVRLRKALVAGQMAFTLILLIGVALFVQTLARLQAKGPGFNSGNLLMFRASPASNGYSDADSTRIMRQLLEKLKNTPIVERAALANTHILSGGTSSSGMTIQAEERIVTDRAVHYMRVTPGFFTALGLQLVAGRDFEQRDLNPSGSVEPAYRSVIVSESFARRYFNNRSPIGYRLGFGRNPGTPTTVEIVGVVKGFSRRTLRDDIEQAFVPFWDRPAGGGTFYVKVHGKPEAAFAAIRAAVDQVDPALPVVDMITLDDQIDLSLATERMLAALSSGFGAIALILSAVGLYGVMSFVVTNRTREIGVRMALGATRSGVMWLVVRDALFMIAVGTVIALPCAWSLRRLVEAQLFGVTAAHGPTIAAAAGFLVAVALVAAVVPSWRATRVSPSHALRPE
jgi:predicted permease